MLRMTFMKGGVYASSSMYAASNRKVIYICTDANVFYDWTEGWLRSHSLIVDRIAKPRHMFMR